MVAVNWTDQAIEDIGNIAEFIAKDSLKYAKIQTQRFFERAEILEKHLKSGRIVPELNDESIRELILGNYRIIYKIVSETQIDILTVHHSRRPIENSPVFSKKE
ncbi:MAG: plasmid stabilization protein [Flavobacteriales bacterium]|nr:MAG: plasmid stabilization protein [Flavobacteriales bacterium]